MGKLLAALLLALGVSQAAAESPTDCRRAAPQPMGNDTLMTPRAAQTGAIWRPGRQFEHVVIIVLENKDYDQVVAHPYFRGLASRGTLLTRFTGLFHPSYANYLAMVGGRYFGSRKDDQIDLPRDVPTIADLLEAKGLTWRQYAEGFPGNCSRAADAKSGRYGRKHVPFLSFQSVTADLRRCSNVVDADRFDRTRLPNYAFYSPGLCHDGHDRCSPFGDRLDNAAKWLNGFLEPILSDADVMNNTLIVVTFDESEDRRHNHVYTLFLGDMVVPGGRVDQCYDHYNVLRTIEDNFGLGTLGGEDARSSSIIGAFRAAEATAK